MLLDKNRIKYIFKTQNWEQIILTAFKRRIILFSDYTFDEVSNNALVYSLKLDDKIAKQNLSKDNVLFVNEYIEELFLFIEETKYIISKKIMYKNKSLKKLTDNQLEYLKLMSKGYNKREILNLLKINASTEIKYKNIVFRYLGVKNWFDAIRVTNMLDLIQSDKIIRYNYFNEIYNSSKELSQLEISKYNDQSSRNLQIYILLINLFNGIELNTLLNNYDNLGHC